MRQGLNAARSSLRAGGIAEWRIEAEVLLRHVLGLERSEFLALAYGEGVNLTRNHSLLLQSLIDRRLSGEPLAYIVGNREFYGLELQVDSRVLIPRQETELLVDIVLERLDRPHPRSPSVVDVGTGSGAIGLAVAANAESANVMATDLSQEALAVARQNAANLGLSGRIEFVHGDLLLPIEGPVDVVVSNLPYIPSGDVAHLAVEVQREPRIALDGGKDGLAHLRRLFQQAKRKLATRWTMIIELMPEQMKKAEMLAVQFLGHHVEVTTRRDLMGNERALIVNQTAGGFEVPDACKRHER